ncbi:hypothetical protein E2G34_15590 [Salmonella enterica subsp. enterica serovar Poona]|nr:hypothetical protein [Salmonella enterica subsp. enterica serovar Poona]EDA8514103.1 hypothetical protein [Salmonella enterica subsp. enterica serovar Poona]
MPKTIEYWIMIYKNYHMVVFDRFKRYDEPQKEFNPINWLGGGFDRFRQWGTDVEAHYFIKLNLAGLLWV